jgi:hypothetical protein
MNLESVKRFVGPLSWGDIGLLALCDLILLGMC